jgi:uncharacterized protein
VESIRGAAPKFEGFAQVSSVPPPSPTLKEPMLMLLVGTGDNAALWLVTADTLITLSVILYVPNIRAVFQFSILHPKDLLVAFGLGVASVTWFEVLKLTRRRRGPLPGRPRQGDRLNFNRIAIVTTGWMFVVAGIAGLFLPFLQGILFLLIGLMILSKEYHWAKSFINRIRSRFPKLDAWITKAQTKAAAILANPSNKGMI